MPHWRDGLGDELLAGSGVGHVGRHDDGTIEVGGQRGQAVGPARGEHNGGPDGVEHAGEPLAEPGGGAGDDGDAAVEAEQGERIERLGHGRRITRGPQPEPDDLADVPG